MTHLRAADLPIEYNASRILDDNLADRADEVALVADDVALTFRRCAERSNQVGHALRGLGVRQGDVVAILAPDVPEWVFAFFGTVKVGAVALGMNTLLKPDDHLHMLRDSRARVLVVHESLLAGLEEMLRGLRELERVIVIGGAAASGRAFAEWIDGEPLELAAAPTHREDVCSLNYSSGTTGEPKGIPHAHKDYPLCAQLWGVDVLGLTAADRTLGAPKLFFTFGLGGNLIFPWYVGASVVLFAGSPRVSADVFRQIERHRPTILYHAPTGYAAMLAESEPGDVSSLRLCVSAGEALPAPIWERWRERFGLEIIDGIGSTENFHIFLSNRPGASRPGSSGQAFPGYELAIVDDDGAEVPVGEVGNLMVRGETAALCYLRREEATRLTFRGEWLFTGDKYRRDEDGFYHHAGRSDDMLKVGGIWVSPVEVESTLLEHPAVLECAVVGAVDDDDLVKPKAYVVVAPGRAAGDELARELVSHCRDRIAEYKRPRFVEFVAELPKTATGKIQRFRLRGG